MRKIAWVLFVFFLLGLAERALAYDEGYPFNQYKIADYRERECGSYSSIDPKAIGAWKASCRLTQLSHTINMGDEKIRKFMALACARGESEEEAKFNARAAARFLISDMQSDDLKRRGRQAETDQVYITDDSTDRCVLTSWPGNGDQTVSVAPAPEPSSDPPPNYAPQPAAPERDPTRATFVLHNKDRYKLGVEFYSQSRNHAWPGGNQQYALLRDGTYNLKCVPGEKICFGAWRDYQNKYWGVGRNGKMGCKGCCITCGAELETTLTDAGVDSFQSTSSGGGGNDAAAIVNGITGIVQGLGGLQSPGGQHQYRAPPPQQLPNPGRHIESGVTRSR